MPLTVLTTRYTAFLGEGYVILWEETEIKETKVQITIVAGITANILFILLFFKDFVYLFDRE